MRTYLYLTLIASLALVIAGTAHASPWRRGGSLLLSNPTNFWGWPVEDDDFDIFEGGGGAPWSTGAETVWQPLTLHRNPWSAFDDFDEFFGPRQRPVPTPAQQREMQLKQLYKEQLQAKKRRARHAARLQRLRGGLEELEKEVQRLEEARAREDKHFEEVSKKHSALLEKHRQESAAERQASKDTSILEAAVAGNEQPRKKPIQVQVTTTEEETPAAEAPKGSHMVSGTSSHRHLGHMEVEESPDKVELVFAVPGLQKEGLDLTVRQAANGQLMLDVRGKRSQEYKHHDEEKGYSAESYSTSQFFRSLPLPDSVKTAEDVAARLEPQAGRLVVTVPRPKSEEEKENKPSQSKEKDMQKPPAPPQELPQESPQQVSEVSPQPAEPAQPTQPEAGAGGVAAKQMSSSGDARESLIEAVKQEDASSGETTAPHPSNELKSEV